MWMIDQGMKLFDHLVIGVGTNPAKTPMFSELERIEMFNEVIKDHTNRFCQKVSVRSMGNVFAVHFANSVGATYIIRGIRCEGDYEYERTMERVNADIEPNVSTVFLMPPRGLAEVSSSAVKGMMLLQGGRDVIKNLVPTFAYKRLLEVIP
jgi:pantetheine-phosphate adenylyltransferase